MFGNNYNWRTGVWTTNPKYQEIRKLDNMLNDANIPHTFDTLMDGWQICYPYGRRDDNCVMDVIEHSGSYGHDDDELEIMGLLTPEEEEWDSVLGNLTAEDVFERIRKHHNGEWDDYIKSLPTTSTEEDPEENSSNVPSTDIPTSPLTPEEFTKQMQEAFDVYYVEQDDEEMVHGTMDDIMCNLLRQLGYGDGVDIFNKTPKWYA